MQTVDVATRFYRALLEDDQAGLEATVDPDVFVGLAGEERHGLEQLKAFAHRLRTVTGGSLRRWSSDSADIVGSEYHGVILDRWLAERDGEKLDQHLAIVVADLKAGRATAVFIYGYDTVALRQFWQ